MSFDWRKLLELSRFLQKNCADFPDQEAVLRTAIGRAYFAAYGHASKVATEKHSFVPTKTADDHGHLRRHFRVRMPAIAEKLEDLRTWRNTCDYDDDAQDVNDSMATKAYGRAEYIFKTLH